MKIDAKTVDKMHLFGTPEELNFYNNFTLNNYGNPRIGLCCDHSGFSLKESVKVLLEKKNIPFIDYGTFTPKDCDYNDFINMSVNGFYKKDINKIFAFCRSGQGVNICGSKYKNIISALIYDEKSAQLAVEHNCANFFSFPSNIWSDKNFENVIKTIISSTFDGAQHQGRIMKIVNEE